MSLSPMGAADRRAGFLMALLGIVILSPDALLVRLINADPAALVVWRSSCMVATLGAWLVWSHGGIGPALARFKTLGPWGVAGAACISIGNFAFNTAISNASAATALALVATSPLWGALFSRFLLNERLPPRSALAVAIGFGGALITAAGSNAAGLGAPGSGILGAVAGVVCAAGFGAQLTFLRKAEGADAVAMLVLGSLGGALAALAFGDPSQIHGKTAALALLLGLIIAPVSFALITLSARHIRSAEVGLVMLAEMPLGSLWVWLVLAEKPSLLAVVGGFVTISAIALFALKGRSQKKA